MRRLLRPTGNQPLAKARAWFVRRRYGDEQGRSTPGSRSYRLFKLFGQAVQPTFNIFGGDIELSSGHLHAGISAYLILRVD